MIRQLKEQIFANERAFYATLVCLCTILINLFYYFVYNASPLTLISILPIVFWIAYDGNEHEKATTQGYWIWVLLLVATTVAVISYPLF